MSASLDQVVNGESKTFDNPPYNRCELQMLVMLARKRTEAEPFFLQETWVSHRRHLPKKKRGVVMHKVTIEEAQETLEQGNADGSRCFLC